MRAGSSRVPEARGGSSVGETEALEGDAHAASVFALSRVAIRTQDFLVFLRRRQCRLIGGGGRMSTMSTTTFFKWLTLVFAEDLEDSRIDSLTNKKITCKFFQF